MAFEKSIHLTDCKYRYTISPNVKKFTLRDTTFVQNKIGNYELHRLLEKVPNSGEGFPLKITINKDLTGFKLSITNLALVTLISLKMKITTSCKKNSTS